MDSLLPRLRHASAAAALLALAACGGGGPHASFAPEDAEPVAVATAVVEALAVPVYEEVVGTVRPRKEAQVSAKVTGRLLEMHAVPGMRVKAGDVLAKLEVGELDAALARAEAALVQADRDLARLRNLRDTGAIAVADYEQAESRQGMAAATVAETRTMVENATVTAPFDGTVTRKFLEPGDLGTPGRAIFSMEDPSLLRLEIHVGESLAGTLALGATFRVEVSGAGAELDGVVGELSPSADVGSRTFLAKLDLPPHQDLRAGQFGRAFLPRGDRDGLLVPAAAVISRGQMDYVFVAEEGVARLRIVSVGATREGRTEILAGLDGGESVVVSPPPSLRDGQPLAGG